VATREARTAPEVEGGGGMANTLAEVVQLQRAEEQANGTRVRWEMRMDAATRNRTGKRMVRVQVMVTQEVADLLAKHGPTSVVGRCILEQWAVRVG
jgi:carbon monoxide dehydrogenase subunit G